MNSVRISAQSGTSFQLKKDQKLTVTSPEARQVADLFCFSDLRAHDALSSGRSIDYNETILFTSGHTLYSIAGFPLLNIEEDTCGRHDFLVTPCSLQMFQMLSNTNSYHPSCHENLCRSFADQALPTELISTTFNIFMNYEFDISGILKLKNPRNKAGDFIVFRACEDITVGLTACADPDTNAGTCKPIEYLISD